MTIIGALPFQLQNGTTADATQVMSDFNKILNDTNTNAAHNGVNTDITALPGLTTPLTPAQGGSYIFYGAGSGTANAQIVASLTPSGFTLTVGYSVYWTPSVGNTGALTLVVNGTAATAVKVLTGSGLEPLIGGEVVISQLAKATFDGTQFVLDLDVMVGFGALTNLASATTTDLGTALSHTVNITGTTTITAFGSTALAARPLYKLVFAGALLLTYNATSLILPGSTSITTAAGDSADALYLGSGNWQVTSYIKRNGQALNFNASFLQNYLSGLGMTVVSTTSISAAAGVAADSTNSTMMVLGSALTKTTSGWAVGTAAGGLDTGAIATGTWYHWYEIMRPDTGVVDVCFSTGASGPTVGGGANVPAAYTLFRRLFSWKTDGSSHWLSGTQRGDDFALATPVQDFTSSNNPGASAITVTLASVPSGIVVEADYNFMLLMASTGNAYVYISALTEADLAPATPAGAGTNPLATGTQVGTIAGGGFRNKTYTNTSQAFRARLSASAGTDSFRVSTLGWKDQRGRLG